MTVKTLKTIKSRILCKKTERKETTDSGIIIAGGSRDEDQWARVVFVGPDFTGDIQVGDMIIPLWNNVVMIKHQGDTYYVVGEDNIAVVENDR